MGAKMKFLMLTITLAIAVASAEFSDETLLWMLRTPSPQ